MGDGEGELLSEGGSNSFDIDAFLLEVRECFPETRELAVVLDELLCADCSSSGHIAILGEELHEVILYGLGRDFLGELLELLEDLLVFATIGHRTHDFARLEGDRVEHIALLHIDAIEVGGIRKAYNVLRH